MIRNLVISGGGIHTIKVVGMLSCLEDNKVLSIQNIEKYISSSGGSILSILLASGFTPKELYNVLKTLYQKYNTFTEDEFANKHIDDIFVDILYSNGMLSSSFIKTWLNELIYNKLNLIDPTFIEFTKKTGKLLNICASNITDHRYEVFSVENTPNIKVIDAICASISIPIIFKPCKIEDKYYLDSGLLNNFPTEYLDKKTDNYNNTIGIRIISNYESEKDDLNFMNFVGSIYKTYINHSFKKDYKYDIQIYDIILEESDTYADLDVNTFKFLINDTVIDNFFHDGYKIAFENLNNKGGEP